MKYALFEVVLLNKILPHHEFLYGKTGTVIEIHTRPNLAYEIEFCDDKGQTIGVITLSENEMDDYLTTDLKEYMANK